MHKSRLYGENDEDFLLKSVKSISCKGPEVQLFLLSIIGRLSVQYNYANTTYFGLHLGTEKKCSFVALVLIYANSNKFVLLFPSVSNFPLRKIKFSLFLLPIDIIFQNKLDLSEEKYCSILHFKCLIASYYE